MNGELQVYGIKITPNGKGPPVFHIENCTIEPSTKAVLELGQGINLDDVKGCIIAAGLVFTNPASDEPR